MDVLFVGDEEEYATASLDGESGSPFSLFFSLEPPPGTGSAAFDALVVPAGRYLTMELGAGYPPIMASGPPELAAECLEAGCDDYIRVPWTGEELLARIENAATRKMRIGEALIVGKRLVGPRATVRLSDDASSILAMLCGNRGRPVPRNAIAAMLGLDAHPGRAVDMRVARLRSSLREVGADDAALALRCYHGAYYLESL